MDIRKRYSADKFDDNQVWGMAELTAVSCIQTDFEHNSEDWSIGYEELEPRRGNGEIHISAAEKLQRLFGTTNRLLY
ncbi:MAG: hypothetical protein ACLU99_07535 [Alphaproteobacteria bacterium]